MPPNWNANSTRTQICTLTEHLLFTYESKWISKVIFFSFFCGHGERWGDFAWRICLSYRTDIWSKTCICTLSFSGKPSVCPGLMKEWLSVKEASNNQLRNIWKRANKRKHKGKFRRLPRLVRNQLGMFLEACECVTPTKLMIVLWWSVISKHEVITTRVFSLFFCQIFFQFLDFKIL